jgi:hypothetical protein
MLWDEEKATGVMIPKSLLSGFRSVEEIEVQLVTDAERGPVLGSLRDNGLQIIFLPVAPFTRGLQYEIFFKGKVIDVISVPLAESEPVLLSIYPTQDTVPENLLKIYLKFSVPMAEEHSLDYVTVIRDSGDTLRGTFLDLKPELWNSGGTVLTLWLDPGRTKRDLIPNRQLGAPLEAFRNYSLRVSGRWKSKDGIETGSDYVKNFVTGARDEISPLPETWKMSMPAMGTSDELTITLNEPLDYSLLTDALRIFDSNHTEVNGVMTVGVEEKSLHFQPALPWASGDYAVRIETRLEDLAGNNLNRTFDRDLKSGGRVEDKKFVEIKFSVR